MAGDTPGDSDVLPIHTFHSLIVQRALNTQVTPGEQNQRSTIFHTKVVVQERAVRMIIDGGSSNNLASREMVDKLSLATRPHPNPYYIQWVNEGGKIKVTRSVRVHFSLGSYSDFVDCDVVPMEACHLLLGRPWQYDTDCVHHGRSNQYSFMFKGRKYILKPMTPEQILEDDVARAARKAQALNSTPAVATQSEINMHDIDKLKDEQNRAAKTIIHSNSSNSAPPGNQCIAAAPTAMSHISVGRSNCVEFYKRSDDSLFNSQRHIAAATCAELAALHVDKLSCSEFIRPRMFVSLPMALYLKIPPLMLRLLCIKKGRDSMFVFVIRVSHIVYFIPWHTTNNDSMLDALAAPYATHVSVRFATSYAGIGAPFDYTLLCSHSAMLAALLFSRFVRLHGILKQIGSANDAILLCYFHTPSHHSRPCFPFDLGALDFHAPLAVPNAGCAAVGAQYASHAAVATPYDRILMSFHLSIAVVCAENQIFSRNGSTHVIFDPGALIHPLLCASPLLIVAAHATFQPYFAPVLADLQIVDNGWMVVPFDPGIVLTLYLHTVRCFALHCALLNIHLASPFRWLTEFYVHIYISTSSMFGVSTCFVVADFRLHTGKKDGMPSRTTLIQEGEDDEDINSTFRTFSAAAHSPARPEPDPPDPPPLRLMGSCLLQLDAYPRHEGGPRLIRFESPRWRPKRKPTSSPTRSPGAVCLKTDAQAAYGLRFRRSTYARKAKEITFPTDPAPCLNSFGVNGNLQNKSTSRFCSRTSSLVYLQLISFLILAFISKGCAPGLYN